MDADKRLEDLLFITTELVELLEKENVALKTNRLDVVQDLIERKTMLCRAYEIRVFGLKQEDDKEAYDEALKGKVQRLTEVGARVETLIIENERMLKVALEVSRRFMDCVADSVQQNAPNTGAYSAHGAVGISGKVDKKQAASLALDETL